MSRMRAFRSALTSIIILVLLSAAPAYPWHGSGTITALAVDPQTLSTLYAGTCDRGAFKSTDRGATWSATGLTNISVSALAIDPQTPTTLYAGATPNDCTGVFVGEWYQANVYKSTDGGTTWTATGLVGVQVTALAIDPKTPTTHLYAGSYWNGVFKSTDGGATWSATGLFSVQTLAIDPVTPSTVYAATAFVGEEGFTWEGGVYKSTDGGTTWSPTGLATGSFLALGIDPRVDRDPLTPATVYAGGVGFDDVGVFKSTDGGATWSVASLLNTIGALTIDPQTPTTLYAGGLGAYKSTDGGATWSAINTGLTDILSAYGVGSAVWSLAIDLLAPNTLYAATSIGVFKSTDGGANWTPTGLFQHSPLLSLSLNPTAVFYGAPSTGTVTLATPAPAGGITVALLSNNPSIATVPASVTVPAGATSANFMISTTPDPWAAWAVSISATFDGVTKVANLMIYATTLSSMYLSPTSVPGGTPSTGTVGLSTAAPAGGATIPLSSSNPAVATVPANVTVPAGATWANFTISTSSVIASTAVRISAANYWAALTVTPTPATTLSSVSLNPASVTSGATSTGTVTLTAGAPTGGATIPLSSSNPAVAMVPASVTVAAGATSANFTVSTVVCTSGSVTISGAYGGATKSAGLTVTATSDTVAIQQADYFANKQELRVGAKSTSPTATLRVYVTSSGDLIGTLRNLGDGKYSGRFTWPVNPQNITVRTSLCGSATRGVTLKWRRAGVRPY